MSGAVVSLNHLGAAWADAMWRASWQGAVALLVALLISRLRPRLSPQSRAWLWRLAFLKLALGLASLPPIALPVLPARTPPPAISLPAAAPTVTPAPAPLPALPAAPATAPAAAIPPAARFDPQAWLLGAWVVMALAYAVHLLRCWGRACRLRRACRPVEEGALTVALAELCRRARVRPPALLVGEVATPLLLGLRRPAIILPRTLLGTCGDAEARLMLAHEVAHLRRRDLLWNWLPLLAQGLFLFHPLVWLGRREWALAQELACDAEALALTAASEAQYGEMLVKVALPRRALRVDPLAAGIAESYHTLRRRLRALAHCAPTTRRRLIAGGLVIAALGLLALAPWSAVAREQSRGRVLLRLPYGSGPGQVGRLYTSEAEASQYPVGPVAVRMIQQTHDGTTWIFDVANGRALAFQEGKQIDSIPLSGRGGIRTSFAVTPQAVFVVEGGHIKHLARYDRARRSATTISLRLPNGEGVLPMWVRPLGARDEAVLVVGNGARNAFRVEGDGRVTVAADMETDTRSLPMAGADGAIWRFRVTSDMAHPAVQGVIERYDAARAGWVAVAAAALPKRTKTDDLAPPVGVDAQGNTLFAISEGLPDLVRFARVDRGGKVLATFALQDLGLGPGLAYAIGGCVQLQLLPDGDLLLLAAAPEGYRVIRVRPPLMPVKPAPVALSRQVAQFVARFTEVYSSNAAIRSDAEASMPMLQAAEEFRKDSESILHQCRTSPATADGVAGQLLAPLEAHARKYRPGSTIDEALLSKETFMEGELPGWDLPADSYLLLKLAKQRRSASFTRRTLTAIADAAAADGYLWEQRALHDHPNEVAREVREAGGYHTQTVDALAWCAESFLVDAYRARPSYLPPAARSEISAYFTWRRAAVAKDPDRHGWVPSWRAYSTLDYARRVAAALPE